MQRSLRSKAGSIEVILLIQSDLVAVSAVQVAVEARSDDAMDVTLARRTGI